MNGSNGYRFNHVNPFSNNVQTSLTFTTSSSLNGFQYRVSFSNCFGITSTLNRATLCSGDVTFASRLRSASVTDRQLVTLFATRTFNQNPPLLTAVWEISSNSGVSYLPLLASDSTYTLSGTPSNMTLQFISIFPTTGRWFRIRYTTCLGEKKKKKRRKRKTQKCFRVLKTNAGTNFSDISKLTVSCVSSQRPVVVTNPQPFPSVVEGQTLNLYADATAVRSGAPNLNVRWEYSTDLGRSWRVVDGSFPVANTITNNPELNQTTLSFVPVFTMSGYQFRASFKVSQKIFFVCVVLFRFFFLFLQELCHELGGFFCEFVDSGMQCSSM